MGFLIFFSSDKNAHSSNIINYSWNLLFFKEKKKVGGRVLQVDIC